MLKITSSLLAGLAFIFLVTANASAFYAPGNGRFISRDPGPDGGMPQHVFANGVPTQHPANMSMYRSDTGPSVSAGMARSNYGATNPMSEAMGQEIFVQEDDEDQDINAGLDRLYRDGTNLYVYVANNPVRFFDPQGTNIYLKTGNNSGNWLNDKLHQNVCVDSCENGRKEVRCFSFGQDGWAWYGPKSTWLGWSSWTAPGYLMEGVIYESEDTGTIVSTKQTTPQQDAAWLNWMLTKRVKTRDVYSVGRHNCRKYSQMEFNDAPGNH